MGRLPQILVADNGVAPIDAFRPVPRDLRGDRPRYTHALHVPDGGPPEVIPQPPWRRPVSTEAEDLHRIISASVRDMRDAFRIQAHSGP